MTASRPVIANRQARAIFLDRHALSEVPSGPGRGADLSDLIKRLGFVQLDSINTVARAHDMILRARRTSYRPKALDQLCKNRTLFEHWTHDASVIHRDFYPLWQLRFQRDAENLRTRWDQFKGESFHQQCETVLAHLAENGACGTGDVGKDEPRSSGGWWDWNPSKVALEYLWRSGRISVCHRVNFRKHYDLTERVMGQPPLAPNDTIEQLCDQALDRLGFATTGEIAAFWDTASAAEAAAWGKEQLARGTVIEVDVEAHDGSLRKHLARPDIGDVSPPQPPGRARVLSPFDPALRDRKRAERLFGFTYRIEVFVPSAKRKYGYYVFPIMEGDRLTARVDATAPAGDPALTITALWPEKGVRLSEARLDRFDAEFHRLARFTGRSEVRYADGWKRETLA